MLDYHGDKAVNGRMIMLNQLFIYGKWFQHGLIRVL